MSAPRQERSAARASGFHLIFFLVLISLFVPVTNSPGQQKPVPSLSSLKFEFDVKRAELWKPEKELQAQYEKQLHQLMSEVTAAADIGKVNAVKDELAGFTNGTSKPAGDDFPQLKRLQGIYAKAAAERSAARNRELGAAFKVHLANLTKLEARLIQEDKPNESQLVSDEIARVEKLAGEIEQAPGSSSGRRSATAAPVLVAKSVRGKAGTEEPATSVISFDAPRGDGRSGAKGILVKSEGGADQGSTWMFHYTRCASSFGLQIIHPRGKGQAIIHIRESGIGISTPGDWRNVGYRGGSADSVRTKEAYDEIFPLENDREYAVMSRMDEKGACEIFIDGKLVATARARSAKPLGLEIPEGEGYPGASSWGELEFKGEGLPMEWEEGWAGLLVGPFDGGTHGCREVRYGPGLADVPE